MAEIALTKGQVTIIDDELFEWLSSFKWYSQGPDFRPARRITKPRPTILFMYHQILSVWPWELRKLGLVVDHKDRNPLNNTRDNLRIVSHQLNMLNSSTSINRIGVGRDNTHNTWKAYIDSPNRNRINIGTFKTKEAALKAVSQYQTGG